MPRTCIGTHYHSAILFLAATVVNNIVGAAATGEENNSQNPNILFAISDDQSFPHAGAYGCEWVETPAFDEIARRGLLFTNCYTPNAKCAPSRSCIVTGRNSWQLESAGNHVCYFPKKYKTFCEALAESSKYKVGFTGKGVAPVKAPGRHLTGELWNEVHSEPPTLGISSIDYAANFARFLNEKPAGRPFCFWYGAMEPHRTYEYGSGIIKGGKSCDQIKTVPGYWPDSETVRADMLDYALEIEHFDKHLGRMLRLLEERGELENTLVVVTSDNGMPFPRCKGAEYEASNHLPLAIMWADGIQTPGRLITDYVSFIDFAPTFLELAGVNNPFNTGMQPIEGRSLTPIFNSSERGRVEPQRDYVLLGQERHDVGRPNDVGYPIRSILKEGMLYIHNFEPTRWPMCDPVTGYLNTDGGPTKTVVLEMSRNGHSKKYWRLCFGKRGAEELYDVRNDPDCLNNLINNMNYRSQIQDLRRKLFLELKAQNDPRMRGMGSTFDEYLYADAKFRDFYNKYLRGEIGKHAPSWVNPGDFEPTGDGHD